MSAIKFYSEKKVRSLVDTRKGETKVGEVIPVISSWSAMKENKATYILLGIPEDIGVRANYGKQGASQAWSAGLKSFCNIQANNSINTASIAILGEIDCETEMQLSSTIDDLEKLDSLVKSIDLKVSDAVERIVSAKKIPIIIGGGHNNCYGNIKGASKAIGMPINVVNFDAHTDYRLLEHRHSGNGFSYAQQEEYLDNYFIVGLHRNYTSEEVFNRMNSVPEKVQFNFFEAISVEKKKAFREALEEADEFCKSTPMGIELDMDAIANMGSSAMTPSGFSVEEARQYVRYFSKSNSAYFHICEGSPKAELFPNQVGKTISYLISDIIAI